MKLSSEHLEILAAIVEKGGLTEGATMLGKSQPSVSRIVSFLEQRIGMALFEPGRRPLVPTELGRHLAEFGAAIHRANAQAALTVARYREGHAGRLRVGGSPVFMDGVVSLIVAEFQQRFNDVHFEQSYGYFDEMVMALRNGSIDLAILPAQPQQVPAGMSFVPLLAGRNVIACRQGHPLMQRRDLTLADVKDCTGSRPAGKPVVPRPAARAQDPGGEPDADILFGRDTGLDAPRAQRIGCAHHPARLGGVPDAADRGDRHSAPAHRSSRPAVGPSVAA
jgi:DNA-binding transcriptional LysR family regulator